MYPLNRKAKGLGSPAVRFAAGPGTDAPVALP